MVTAPGPRRTPLRALRPDKLAELLELTMVRAPQRGDVATAVREVIRFAARGTPCERWSLPSLQQKLRRQPTVPAVPVGPGMDPHELVMEPCGEFVERIMIPDECVVLRRGIREQVPHKARHLGPTVRRDGSLRLPVRTGPSPCLAEHATMEFLQRIDIKDVDRASRQPLHRKFDVLRFPLIEFGPGREVRRYQSLDLGFVEGSVTVALVIFCQSVTSHRLVPQPTRALGEPELNGSSFVEHLLDPLSLGLETHGVDQPVPLLAGLSRCLLTHRRLE